MQTSRQASPAQTESQFPFFENREWQYNIL